MCTLTKIYGPSFYFIRDLPMEYSAEDLWNLFSQIRRHSHFWSGAKQRTGHSCFLKPNDIVNKH